MQKIGIYGGSFNPIHNGHINLMQSYMKALSLDKIIIIPTNIPPHKRSDELACASDRLNMVNFAVQTLGEKYLADDIEIKRTGKSYSVDTLNELKKRYPSAELYLIMGSDMFLTLHEWYKAQEILRLATICTACREKFCDERMLKQKLDLENQGADVVLFDDIDILPMSSTEIREDVKNKEDISKKVLPKVKQYILENGLYRN